MTALFCSVLIGRDIHSRGELSYQFHSCHGAHYDVIVMTALFCSVLIGRDIHS